MSDQARGFFDFFSFSIGLLKQTTFSKCDVDSVDTENPSRIKPDIDSSLDLSRVCVAIPALNEEKNLEDLFVELKATGFNNVIVIDGKSTDRTIDVALRNGASVILQNGQGKGNAVKELLARGYLNVDSVVLMDADGSMSPKEIPLLIKALNSGADVVKASRFMKGGSTYDMTLTRKIGNFLLMSVVNFLWATKYSDLCYGFIAFNKSAMATISPYLKSKNFEIEAEIFIKAAKLGLVVTEVPSTELERKSGMSNLKTFEDGCKILQTILKEFFVTSN